MILFYSGTPGSGKSFHAAKDILHRFKLGGGLICNFPVSVISGVRPKKELRVSYWDNSEITPLRLTSYATKYHTLGIEGQTLLIIDEAQILWNSRDSLNKSRADWIKFFSQHRKLGFDVIMIAQADRMIDRQIRGLIETEVKHRKLNNYGFGGMMLSLFTGGCTWFVAIDYWYGGNKTKLDQSVFPYRKSVAAVYDSYLLFDDVDGKNSIIRKNGDGCDADLRLMVYEKNKKTAKNARKDLKPCMTTNI